MHESVNMPNPKCPERRDLGRVDLPTLTIPQGDATSIRLICPRCDAVITAGNEDELVANVRSHVRDDHGATHTLSRKHILAPATPSQP